MDLIFAVDLNAVHDISDRCLGFGRGGLEKAAATVGGDAWMKTIFEKRLLNERRSDMQIIVRILETAMHGAGKTEIVYGANLNFTQAGKYLKFLLDKELLEVSNLSVRKGKYRTTETGKAFVKRYKETVESIT